MAKRSGQSFTLPKIEGLSGNVSELFTTQEERDDKLLERVRHIPLARIDPFPDHPFKVREDAGFFEMMESIQNGGVHTPAIVRPVEDGRYEMISGHRRMRACEKLGLETIPAVVREMDKDTAILMMVECNEQRDVILPSEKAWSYKMQLEAMRRQQGRTQKNCVQVEHNFNGARSREILAAQSADSAAKIQRYIRLTHLIPEFLAIVDNSILKESNTLQMAMGPAVELSFLTPEEQGALLPIMEKEGHTPSIQQAQMLKRYSLEGKLDVSAMSVILAEVKPNQREQIRLPREKISKFIPPHYTPEQAEEHIEKALEHYERHLRNLKRSQER